MHATFDPVAALILFAWTAIGGVGVYAFLRQPHPKPWHWVSLVVGGFFLALGLFFGSWGLYTFWRMSQWSGNSP